MCSKEILWKKLEQYVLNECLKEKVQPGKCSFEVLNSNYANHINNLLEIIVF